MHTASNPLVHAPCSVGALMDPDFLRRAVNDADPPYANEHPAAPARGPAAWRLLRRWLRARLAGAGVFGR